MPEGVGQVSSKRRIRRKMCEGKKRHASREAAMVAVSRLAKKGAYTTPYLCRFCHGWHVGHPSAAVRASMRSEGRG